MGFLRRLVGGGEAATSQQSAAPPAPAPMWPELPRIEKPQLPHKADRPYRTSACPSCAVELTPLPKAKKACPSCHAAIYVKSSADGYIDLVKEANLESWDLADREKRSQAFDAFEAHERATLKAAGFLVGESGWSVEVVGESHYQHALERIVGGRTERGSNLEVAALLLREPTNRWDKNAIRVVIYGETVGYIGRDDCADVQPLIRKLESQGRQAWVRATINGGWINETSRGSFGVVLDDLPEDDEI